MFSAWSAPFGSLQVGFFIQAGGDQGEEKMRMPGSPSLCAAAVAASIMSTMPDSTSCVTS
eukprot:scaffold11161_cov52-Attheya_sp.AAC.3